MTATITASVQADQALVALQLTGDDDTAVVYRVEPSGEVREIRGSPFNLSGGTGLAFDYEAPFDEPLLYLVTSSGDPGQSEEVVVPSFDRDWLKSIIAPSRSLAVEVVLFPDKTSDGRVALYEVLGRREPVAHTDVMSAYTGTVTLFVEGSDVGTVSDALQDGYPLLLQTPPTHGEDRFYFATLSAKWSRVVRRAQDAGRYLELSVAEVDAARLVLGVPVSVYDWDGVVADYATWDDVVAAFPTWNDLLLHGLTLPGV